MTTKAELEQENEILSAELEEAQRTIATMRVELDAARGRTELVTKAAEDAGVALAIPATPAEAESPPHHERCDECSRQMLEVRRVERGLDEFRDAWSETFVHSGEGG